MPRSIRTILVTYPEHNAIAEAKSLADSAGYSVEKIVTQKNITSSKYGVGRGKAQSQLNNIICRSYVKLRL